MPAVQRRGGAISCGDTQAAGAAHWYIDGSPVVLLGDLSNGHGGFPPTPVIEGSPTVFCQGRAVVRKNDRYLPHSDGTTTHVDRRAVQDGFSVIDEPLSAAATALLQKLARA